MTSTEFTQLFFEGLPPRETELVNLQSLPGDHVNSKNAISHDLNGPFFSKLTFALCLVLLRLAQPFCFNPFRR